MTKGSEVNWQDFFKFVKDSDSNSEPINPNLFQLTSFVLSLPASNAFPERIFSLMASKWRTDRNRMSVSLVSAELQVFTIMVLTVEIFIISL